MQTILGSGGAIGNELAKALREYTDQVRLVSRNPRKVYDDDILHPANLLNANETEKAVDGSEIAYLTVGLPYKAEVWQTAWPTIMHNVIQACRIHGTRLVFFDNVYMYDKNHLNPMTEETPVNPPAKREKCGPRSPGCLWMKWRMGIYRL
ncbi:MAG: NAD-dependent epimerase/dehydratase family protein [Balneolaceae bacterium]|nr:NAD-dependent epimerase/dehydratase family protein [Balneolaceae bacterium]